MLCYNNNYNIYTNNNVLFLSYLLLLIYLNRPGWITIHTIMERRADEIRGYLSGDDLNSLSSSSYGPTGTRKLARAVVNLDIHKPKKKKKTHIIKSNEFKITTMQKKSKKLKKKRAKSSKKKN